MSVNAVAVTARTVAFYKKTIEKDQTRILPVLLLSANLLPDY
jgi:hypothetical protein